MEKCENCKWYKKGVVLHTNEEYIVCMLDHSGWIEKCEDYNSKLEVE